LGPFWVQTGKIHFKGGFDGQRRGLNCKKNSRTRITFSTLSQPRNWKSQAEKKGKKTGETREWSFTRTVYVKGRRDRKGGKEKKKDFFRFKFARTPGNLKMVGQQRKIERCRVGGWPARVQVGKKKGEKNRKQAKEYSPNAGKSSGRGESRSRAKANDGH